MAENISSASSKKLVLAGAGKNGLYWLEKFNFEGIDVLCFADQDESKTGKEICGKPVVRYSELKEIQDDIDIFITVKSESVKREIEELLLEMGFGSRIIGHHLYRDKKISEKAYIYNSFLEGNNLVLENAVLVNSYLGICSYLSAGAKMIGVKIGKYTCIGPDVRIITGQHPTSGFVSLHPAFYSTKNVIGYSYVEQDKFPELRYAEGEYSVIIGNDVWIGMGVHIMEGVTIADGSIIAAGAVVVKNTEPFEIVGGIPAKHIRYRFSKEERIKLSEIQWWNRDLKWIKEHAEEFDDIKEFVKLNG